MCEFKLLSDETLDQINYSNESCPNGSQDRKEIWFCVLPVVVCMPYIIRYSRNPILISCLAF